MKSNMIHLHHLVIRNVVMYLLHIPTLLILNNIRVKLNEVKLMLILMFRLLVRIKKIDV